jgi:hypothetical protein
MPQPSISSVGTFGTGAVSPGSPPSTGARLVYAFKGTGGSPVSVAPSSVSYGGIALTFHVSSDRGSDNNWVELWSCDTTGHSGTTFTSDATVGQYGEHTYAWIEDAGTVVAADTQSDVNTTNFNPQGDWFASDPDPTSDQMALALVSSDSDGAVETSSGNWANETNSPNSTTNFWSTGTSTGSSPLDIGDTTPIYSDNLHTAVVIMLEDSGGAPTEIELSGSTSVSSSSSASLEVSRELTGSTSVSSGSSAAVQVGKPLAGSTSTTSSASGTITVDEADAVNLSGSTSVSAGASGTVSVAKPLSGSTSATASASGTVTVGAADIALAGACTVQSGSNAALHVERELSGSASAASASSATLTVVPAGTIALNGTCSVTSAVADAAIDVGKPLTGLAAAAAIGAGVVYVVKPLAGSLSALSGSSATLFTGQRLSGRARGESSLAGLTGSLSARGLTGAVSAADREP